MKINKSGAALSRIVQIGETLKELSRKNGKEYLPLNRGVNQVVNIDLTEVVNSFEFHSCERTPQVDYLLRLRRHRGFINPQHLVIIVYGVDYQGI